MKRHLSAVGAVILSAAALLMAGTTPSQAQELNPCAKDLKQYCASVTPGSGRLLRCYEENKDKMSTDCRGWAEAAKINANNLKQVCSKEIDARCNSEKGDPLEMLDCLQGHYIDLSMECRVRLNEFKGRYPKPVH